MSTQDTWIKFEALYQKLTAIMFRYHLNLIFTPIIILKWLLLKTTVASLYVFIYKLPAVDNSVLLQPFPPLLFPITISSFFFYSQVLLCFIMAQFPLLLHKCFLSHFISSIASLPFYLLMIPKEKPFSQVLQLPTGCVITTSCCSSPHLYPKPVSSSCFVSFFPSNKS